MSFKDERDKAAENHGNCRATPIIRSMYPSKSRVEMADEFSISFQDGADWALQSEVVRGLVTTVYDYKHECENPVPDALFKRTLRERMFKALESYAKAVKENE